MTRVEGNPIEYVSLRQAGRELGEDSRTIKGAALGLGIRLEPIARSLLMSAPDFERLRAHIERQRTAESASV